MDHVWKEFEELVNLSWRAFPLEIINNRPAPKHIVDQEWPLVAVQEPLAPCIAWPHEEYLSTTLLAYEAYKSAFVQSPLKSRIFDLKLRRAFFYEGRRIDKNDVLCEIASESNLEVDKIRNDLECRKFKKAVMEDYKDSMNLRDNHNIPMTSPTLIFPNGKFVHNPYASDKKIKNGKLTEVHAPIAYGEDVYQGFRRILRDGLL